MVLECELYIQFAPLRMLIVYYEVKQLKTLNGGDNNKSYIGVIHAQPP